MIKTILCVIAIAVCMIMMVETKAEVWQDPYGYWIYTGKDGNQKQYTPTKQETLDAYYSNYLKQPPNYQPTRIEIRLEDDYYSNYLEEIKIRIK
jgi:hypothetical protein